MTFPQSFIYWSSYCIRNWHNGQGRASRTEFWMTWLACWAAASVLLRLFVLLRQKPSLRWCSAIDSRSIVNEPAQSTKFLTISTNPAILPSPIRKKTKEITHESPQSNESSAINRRVARTRTLNVNRICNRGKRCILGGRGHLISLEWVHYPETGRVHYEKSCAIWGTVLGYPSPDPNSPAFTGYGEQDLIGTNSPYIQREITHEIRNP